MPIELLYSKENSDLKDYYLLNILHFFSASKY
jgi:hypothetical protein